MSSFVHTIVSSRETVENSPLSSRPSTFFKPIAISVNHGSFSLFTILMTFVFGETKMVTGSQSDIKKSAVDHAKNIMATVTLVSSDNKPFVVERVVADHASTIKMLLEDVDDDTNIPVPNVNAKCMRCIIDMMTLYNGEDDKGSKEKIKASVKDFDNDTLFEVLLAANFLNIPIIVDTMCQVMADMIKGKSPEEIRKTFNIESDWEPEEYERVRKTYSWAFEG